MKEVAPGEKKNDERERESLFLFFYFFERNSHGDAESFGRKRKMPRAKAMTRQTRLNGLCQSHFD